MQAAFSLPLRRMGAPLSLLVVSLVLAGCAVGPDFKAPDAQLPAQWWSQSSMQKADADFTQASPDDAWWERFGDPVLSKLMRRMADSNLDLQVAASRFEQSLAISGGIAANGAPQLSASGGVARARNSQNGLLDPSNNSGKAAYNLWQGGVQAAWELDLWGRVKREREAAQARVEVARETRYAALVSLSAVLAQDYIRLRGVQSERRIAEENLALARHTLRLTQVRVAEGVATRLEVEQAATQVAEVQARLPGLQQREAELSNAISLLLAMPPQALTSELQVPSGEVDIPDVTLPVAVGLPSELAARRPDIRRAEAVLHAATADVGVAEGDFYPRITLSGSVGVQALQLSDFGSWSSRSFSIGPSVSLPVFDGGRLRAMLRLRTAQQQEVALAYRKTVLSAWHEVDDAMGAWQAGAITRDRLNDALSHSRAAWDNAQRQYAQGTVDYLHVLNAQATLLRNQSALSGSRVAVSLALVHLYQSLGGGWQQEAETPVVQIQPLQERTSG